MTREDIGNAEMPAAPIIATPNGPQPENSRAAPSAAPRRKLAEYRSAFFSAGLSASAVRSPSAARSRSILTAMIDLRTIVYIIICYAN